MKRLTEKVFTGKDGKSEYSCYASVRETNNCLGELEDKLESGKLIELPCKVGDTVWVVDKFLKYQLCEGVVETITLNKYTKPQMWISYRYFLQGIGDCTREKRIDLLENVFFNKLQAEVRLKELQEEK